MTAPDPQPPAAPETESAWQEVWQTLADHQWSDWECSCGGVRKGSGEYEDNHLADVLSAKIADRHAALLADLDAARERVREVESERDAARREERMRAEDHARAWREVAAAEARAESAEAAHEALRAVAEDIAYQHAATIDGEFGCCHDEAALRAGGRVAEFDGDEFEPIPDDCPGKQALDRHLAQIAREAGR